ncbi:hypothetical protein DSO57_1009553 [Entomophthora muscae]|uniref:Uncharacterized protein n=1 Tax=Entomophthora muscae TaxID=34485 RepID=A0ACC2S8U1_9FUNG|nr:hypothetical protein DSO57_1009553 [Entomophthora muscae]
MILGQTLQLHAVRTPQILDTHTLSNTLSRIPLPGTQALTPNHICNRGLSSSQVTPMGLIPPLGRCFHLKAILELPLEDPHQANPQDHQGCCLALQDRPTDLQDWPLLTLACLHGTLVQALAPVSS